MKKVKSILLVDDDNASNYLTKLFLEDLDVAEQIHVTLNGQDALDFIRTHCPQASCPELILLDLNMPVMNGFEFLEQFEKLSIDKHVSVIILTSSQYHKDLEKAKNYSIRGYLTKPIAEEEFTNVLRGI